MTTRELLRSLGASEAWIDREEAEVDRRIRDMVAGTDPVSILCRRLREIGALRPVRQEGEP